MPLFSRSLKHEGDEGAPADDIAAEAGARHTVGELLRETRQSYGGNIDHIAATLRIRAAYLTAIEESQYGKLPGPVYAQGFVRAYAVHLGLDGDEAVRRFKQEVEGLGVTRDLSFPVPLAERSIPGGTMLLAALILAVCGYGLWYYVSTGDRTHPERVSAVPPDIVAASQGPAASATKATPPASGGAVTPSSATASAAPPSSSPSVAAAPSSFAPSSPTATATAAPPAPTSVLPTPAAPPSLPVAPSPTAAAPATPSLVSNTAAAAPPPVATSTPQIAAAPSTEPPPDNAVTPATPAPRVYGAPANVPARIIVHAIKESWVQVRNGDNVLTQRTLRPGDTVRIPDEPDLTLRTGNGAGIEFEVDGKLGKPLSGTVRTVALDPDRLASGRPVVNQPGPNQAAHQADQDPDQSQ